MSHIKFGEDSDRDRRADPIPPASDDADHPPTSSPGRRTALTTLSIGAAVLGAGAAAISLIPAAPLAALLASAGALGTGILAMQLRTPRPLFAIVGVVLGALSVVVAISVGVNTAPRKG